MVCCFSCSLVLKSGKFGSEFFLKCVVGVSEFMGSFFKGEDSIVEDILVTSVGEDGAGDGLTHSDQEVVEPCPEGFPGSSFDSWHGERGLLRFGELALTIGPKAHLVDQPANPEEDQGRDEFVEKEAKHGYLRFWIYDVLVSLSDGLHGWPSGLGEDPVLDHPDPRVGVPGGLAVYVAPKSLKSGFCSGRIK